MDEREAIQQFMKEHNMKLHEAIKFAIRQFFFPQERTIPLNGKEAHVVEKGATPSENIIKIEGYPSAETAENIIKLGDYPE